MHAFRSVPAEQLARVGYVVNEGSNTVFRAPDVEVLLSESFAATHCFHVEPPTLARPGLVGVGFRPTVARDQVVDIAGTFWVDRESSELRSLEFQFTDLPPVAASANPGGVVDFLHLPNGTWLVNRWRIRMPLLSGRGHDPYAIVPGVRRVESQAVLTAIRVSGGEVLRVRRADTTLFASTRDALPVQVASSDGGVSTVGATLSLSATDQVVTADQHGVARLGFLLEGQYRALLRTPLMDSLGIAARRVEFAVSDAGARVDTLFVPAMRDLLRAICGAEVAERSFSHLRGVVRDTAGNVLSNSNVTVTWLQQESRPGTVLSWREQSLEARTRTDGQWKVCGVPRDVVLTVRATLGDGAGEQRMRLGDGDAFASAVLVIASNAEAGGRRASIEIAVVGPQHAPIPDALVELMQKGGARRVVRTDSLGRALIPAVSPGQLRVRVRSVGYQAGELVVDAANGRNTVPILLHAARRPQLDTVRVVGDRPVLARYAALEVRRQRGDATASISRDEIEQRNPVSTWQMLRRVPSLQIVDSADVVAARSSRDVHVPCYFRLAIDGLVRPEQRPNLAQLPPPSEVYAIEVFSGAASVPVQYSAVNMRAYNDDTRSCGLIAVWTR